MRKLSWFNIKDTTNEQIISIYFFTGDSGTFLPLQQITDAQKLEEAHRNICSLSAFLTDVHLNKENRAMETKALRKPWPMRRRKGGFRYFRRWPCRYRWHETGTGSHCRLASRTIQINRGWERRTGPLTIGITTGINLQRWTRSRGIQDVPETLGRNYYSFEPQRGSLHYSQ